MPGPDPQAVWIDESANGRLTVSYEVFLITNRSARKRRALALLRNVCRGGWLCPWCREPVPLFRRADARFCGESCRKKAARQRRAAHKRQEWRHDALSCGRTARPRA